MNEAGETIYVETTDDISLARVFLDEEDARDFKSSTILKHGFLHLLRTKKFKTYYSSGSGLVWLEHLSWAQGTAGSNPAFPTMDE